MLTKTGTATATPKPAPHTYKGTATPTSKLVLDEPFRIFRSAIADGIGANFKKGEALAQAKAKYPGTDDSAIFDAFAAEFGDRAVPEQSRLCLKTIEIGWTADERAGIDRDWSDFSKTIAPAERIAKDRNPEEKEITPEMVRSVQREFFASKALTTTKALLDAMKEAAPPTGRGTKRGAVRITTVMKDIKAIAAAVKALKVTDLQKAINELQKVVTVAQARLDAEASASKVVTHNQTSPQGLSLLLRGLGAVSAPSLEASAIRRKAHDDQERPPRRVPGPSQELRLAEPQVPTLLPGGSPRTAPRGRVRSAPAPDPGPHSRAPPEYRPWSRWGHGTGGGGRGQDGGRPGRGP